MTMALAYSPQFHDGIEDANTQEPTLTKAGRDLFCATLYQRGN